MKNASPHFMSDIQDDVFKKFIAISACIHLLFFVIGGLKQLILPSDIIELPQSIRVDVVALPDKPDPDIKPEIKKTAPAPTPAAPVKKETKTEPAKKEVPKENTKESQRKALEKLKAMSALEKLEKEVAESQQKEKEKAAQAQQESKPIKGNIISSGNSFSGLSKLKVNDYLMTLTSKVRENWELPQWLNNANLKASVIVQIDSRGVVVKNEIYHSSGNQVFDSNCLAVVEKAGPFAPPPSEIVDNMILIRFPFE